MQQTRNIEIESDKESLFFVHMIDYENMIEENQLDSFGAIQKWCHLFLIGIEFVKSFKLCNLSIFEFLRNSFVKVS